jgi:hypothetical protein
VWADASARTLPRFEPIGAVLGVGRGVLPDDVDDGSANLGVAQVDGRADVRVGGSALELLGVEGGRLDHGAGRLVRTTDFAQAGATPSCVASAVTSLTSVMSESWRAASHGLDALEHLLV